MMMTRTILMGVVFTFLPTSKNMYGLLGSGATERWLYWKSRSSQQVRWRCLFFIIFFNFFVSVLRREQGWRNVKSTRLPPMWHWPRVRFLDLASYVGWVSWFSALLQEVFLRVLRFSPLLKNQPVISFLYSAPPPPPPTNSYLSAKYGWHLNKICCYSYGMCIDGAVFVDPLPWWPEFILT